MAKIKTFLLDEGDAKMDVAGDAHEHHCVL